MNFYKRYMGDYAKKTARLTLAQHGAYTLLLDEVYVTEQPLPGDPAELFRICRAMNKAEQEAVRYVADKYFPVGPDGLRHNERAEDELIQAAPALEAARLNGKKGGRPKKEPSGIFIDNPVGFQNITQQEPNSKPPHSSDKEKEPNGSVARTSLPTCQTQSVVDLFHEVLPELPAVRLLNPSRKKAIAGFWKFALTSKRSDGTARATDAESALLWIRDYFERTRENDFLMGRGPKASGHENWTCDIDFLLSDKGKKHVIEKTRNAA